MKVGTGTLTLSGNANLGGTTIDGGTLAVNGGTLKVTNTITVGSSAGTSGTLLIRRGRDRTPTARRPERDRSTRYRGRRDLDRFWRVHWRFTGLAGHGERGRRRLHMDERRPPGRRRGHGHACHRNGGRVNSSSGGSVGLSAGSTGSRVTGPVSTWNNGPGGGLNIGSFGAGALTISNGGMVINNTAFAADIGEGAGSQGTVTVTGRVHLEQQFLE